MLQIYPHSYSQSGQESFVLSVLKGQTEGTFIEIGAFHSKELSNTYLLESQFNWKGFAFEIDKKRCKEYNKNRENLCLLADATKFDYLQFFIETEVPELIDYLQVDIEPAAQSLAALQQIPFDKYNFKIITFEHDLYAEDGNLQIQNSAHQLLSRFGYKRIAMNVKNNGLPYEDWYINPAFLDSTFRDLELESNVDWQSLFS